jgi:hypothetical protein
MQQILGHVAAQCQPQQHRMRRRTMFLQNVPPF